MESSRHQTAEERSEFGKTLRKQTPRTSDAQWPLESERCDPIGLLEEQNTNRLDWLIPVRRARMMASPFAFFRGAARIMAADLSKTPARDSKCRPAATRIWPTSACVHSPSAS